MSDESFSFLKPLLSVQPRINKVSILSGGEIPSDSPKLDIYRFGSGFNLAAGNTPDHLAKTYGLCVDVANQWLEKRRVKRDFLR
jgi:hypothetical protein